MMRAVIADDEVLARQKLRALLRHESDVEIVGECASAAETIELVRATRPELLFLDIRMPDMDGFDLAESLSADEKDAIPHLILTTAYDQYAVRAFEIHAVDYLLKPFTVERLRAAVQRARHRAEFADNRTIEPASESNEPRYTTRIVFKSRGRILFLPVDEIRWIGAEENYVRIRTATESHLLRDTMTRIETRLDPSVFLRVHRSSIVNLRYVKEVKSQADGEAIVVLTNGESVAMSRSYRSRIYKLLHR
jgi:two-component system LytT family response regulator